VVFVYLYIYIYTAPRNGRLVCEQCYYHTEQHQVRFHQRIRQQPDNPIQNIISGQLSSRPRVCYLCIIIGTRIVAPPSRFYGAARQTIKQPVRSFFEFRSLFEERVCTRNRWHADKSSRLVYRLINNTARSRSERFSRTASRFRRDIVICESRLAKYIKQNFICSAINYAETCTVFG